MRRRLVLGDSLPPEELARLARLRYVSDQQPGITRRRNGAGFVYANGHGLALRDPRKLRRIETLAIPPAWRDVWICSYSTGHLQSTGRDARKRKQYLYHERWQHFSNLAKFSRLGQFGRVLPKVRQAVATDLARRSLTKNRVLAGMVTLLDLTGIRVGNEEYVKENGSYGLTTLRNRHVTVGQKLVELSFRAKGGVRRDVRVEDKRLARLIRECSRLRGARVFQYLDADGRPRPLTAQDVNEYIQALSGHPFTAKDFRTWTASARAAGRMVELQGIESTTRRKKAAREVVCEAAAALSNTPTVCRNYYIHPGLLESFEDGSFDGFFAGFKPTRRKGLSREEQALAHFLRSWRPAPTA